MNLSRNNAMTLVIDLNRNIEEYAEATVKYILEDRNVDFLTYPPNNGLSDSEKAEIFKLGNNENLKNALRKILANNSAGVVFDLLNLIDGTSSPGVNDEKWSGVKLVDEESEETEDKFNDMLHDEFYGSYWDWKKIRGEKGWKLDAYDE